ncbi:hypothetical protein RND71_017539 [Anisodus tanguticus]|uniref:Presenilin n=1 Tax=Anisodus tanguticus TaxID=243964 RepID=A0AAE1S3X4_9SOLA|nr:hypothetical protein RND71_017539 [Anisodus tanguticus]
MDQNSKPKSVLDSLGEEIVRIITPVSICMLLVVILISVLNNDSDSSGPSFTSIATYAYTENSSDSNWDKLKAVFMSKTAIVVTQGYLVVIGVFVAYWFALLPEWTTWVLLVAMALYDLAAVLLPGGPLRLLVELAISRDEDIPALVYEARPVVNPDSVPRGAVVQRRVWRERRENDDGSDDNLDSRSNLNSTVNSSLESSSGLERLGDENARNGVDVVDGQVSRADSGLAAPLIQHRINVRMNLQEGGSSDDFALEGIGLGSSGAIKLGLGDFIFYSVLVARAAMYDFMTVYACYLAIVAGLGITLMLLAFYQKALPALPVSVLLGVLFYLLTRLLLETFVVQCSMNLLMF